MSNSVTFQFDLNLVIPHSMLLQAVQKAAPQYPRPRPAPPPPAPTSTITTETMEITMRDLPPTL